MLGHRIDTADCLLLVSYLADSGIWSDINEFSSISADSSRYDSKALIRNHDKVDENNTSHEFTLTRLSKDLKMG